MPDKDIFVLKIVWKKSIASLQCLTQAVQRANLRRTAGNPTWVFLFWHQILHCAILSVFRPLFGRIDDALICFWDLVTLKTTEQVSVGYYCDSNATSNALIAWCTYYARQTSLERLRFANEETY